MMEYGTDYSIGFFRRPKDSVSFKGYEIGGGFPWFNEAMGKTVVRYLVSGNERIEYSDDAKMFRVKRGDDSFWLDKVWINGEELHFFGGLWEWELYG